MRPWSCGQCPSPLRRVSQAKPGSRLMGRRGWGHTLGFLPQPCMGSRPGRGSQSQVRPLDTQVGLISPPSGRGSRAPGNVPGRGGAQLSPDDGCLPPAPPPAPAIWTRRSPPLRGRGGGYRPPPLTREGSRNPSLRPHPLPFRVPICVLIKQSWSIKRAGPGGSWGRNGRAPGRVALWVGAVLPAPPRSPGLPLPRHPSEGA